MKLKESAVPLSGEYLAGQAPLDQVDLRHELLTEVLGEKLFDEVFAFYKKIFSQDADLFVFMSRKAWCVVQLFLPLLKAKEILTDEDIKTKLTHDRMVHPWFSELAEDQRRGVKAIVVDDTFQSGRAMDECIRRLRCVYGVADITVAVFAITDDTQGVNRKRIDSEDYRVFRAASPSHEMIDCFNVKWIGWKAFRSKEEVSRISSAFVLAFHACGVPYVGYVPAFSVSYEAVKNFLGTDRGKDIQYGNVPGTLIPGYLEQGDLQDADLRNSNMVGYYNITSQQMRQHDVEAFYFSLPDSGKRDYTKFFPEFFPSEDVFSIAALRFYVNRRTRTALVVPYLSLKDCYADRDIVRMFPEEIKPLLEEMPSALWKDNEERIAAYRLLRYAAAYLWGKYVIKQCFGSDAKEGLVSNGGICSKAFFNWLDGHSAQKDLMRMWSFFNPKEGNVVEEMQGFEPDSEATVKDIIRRGIKGDEPDHFIDVIDSSLFEPVPVDYYSTVSMMFRNILTREHDLLKESKKEKNIKAISLVPPFHGFPIPTFFALLLLKFPKLKTRQNVLTTVTLMLCDMGIGVTQLCQRDGIIRTVLFNGEQSCHSLAPIAPEYALFLSELPQLVKNPEPEQREKKFKMARAEAQEYFEVEKKQGVNRRLSVPALMDPLDRIKDIVINSPDQEFDAYSVLPRSSFFDCSEPFFLDLRERLKS